MTTTTDAPNVYLVIDGSAIAYDEGGEVLETVEFLPDGTPDWSEAGGCDHRGMGGRNGFDALRDALDNAERNARFCGIEIRRVPRES